MHAIVENGTVKQIIGEGNYWFCDTVFQPASTLSPAQKQQFNVVEVVDQLTPYDEMLFYHEGFSYLFDGSRVVATFNLQPLQRQHYEAMRQGAVDRGQADRVAQIDAIIAAL